MSTKPWQRTYDHRLVRLVRKTGDATIATGIGVPRSTVAGWLKRSPLMITTAPGLEVSATELRVRVAKLEKRVARLTAVLHIFFALFRLLQPDLTRLRVPHGCDKARLASPSASNHLKGPRVGIRASKPDEIWHIDTILIRLLDGTRVYRHTVIDSSAGASCHGG